MKYHEKKDHMEPEHHSKRYHGSHEGKHGKNEMLKPIKKKKPRDSGHGKMGLATPMGHKGR